MLIIFSQHNIKIIKVLKHCGYSHQLGFNSEDLKTWDHLDAIGEMLHNSLCCCP